MSALLLQSEADNLVHDSFSVETEDHEDHTFNGVMFDILIKANRPISCLVIDAVHVRGGLGGMTVWARKGGFHNFEEKRSKWRRHLRKEVASSRSEFVQLTLDAPIVCGPDERWGIYVHSNDESDEGVVYDNQRSPFVHDDELITVLPGLAHLSSTPFNGDGFWGRPWRMHRSFVGCISYGVRYKLWDPRTHVSFTPVFRFGASAAFAKLCMGWGGLPSDCILYILNLVRFDWFEVPPVLCVASGDEESHEEEDDEDDDALDSLLTRVKTRYDTASYSRWDNIDDDDDDTGAASRSSRRSSR